MSFARYASYQPKGRARKPQPRAPALSDLSARGSQAGFGVVQPSLAVLLSGVAQPASFLGRGVVQPPPSLSRGAVQPALVSRPGVAQPAPGAVAVPLHAEANALVAWSRLPPPVVAALRQQGVHCVDALRALSDARFQQLTLAPCLLQASQGALAALRHQPFDEALFLQHVLTLPRPRSGLTVHAAMGLCAVASPFAGPPPTSTLSALSRAAHQGTDIASILDGVADWRAGCGIGPATANTYASHFRQIRFACLLLKQSAVPATLSTIRRVSSVVNHPSTLRGWLAAWRHIHLLGHHTWAGDGDSFLRAVRLGLVKSMGPPILRKRMRKPRLLRVLHTCVRSKLFLEGAAAALAYVFCLRVPSELLRQAECDHF